MYLLLNTGQKYKEMLNFIIKDLEIGVLTNVIE